MELKRVGSQPSMTGPEAWFTGTVRIDPLSSAHEPSRVSLASVTFEPGARSAWHTHPLGQTLVVTAGCVRTVIVVIPGPAWTTWLPFAGTVVV